MSAACRVCGLAVCPEWCSASKPAGTTGFQVNTITVSAIKEKKTGSTRFHEILYELSQLHDRKQADYGISTDPFANVRASSDFGVKPWIGAVLRGNDKMQRIKSFIANGNLKNESLEDSLRDLAVYCIIALVLREEENASSG